MLALAPKDFPEKMGPFWSGVSGVIWSDKDCTYLDCEGGPLTGDGRRFTLREGHLAGGVCLHRSQEAGLCAVLCYLSQDARRADGGRLEELRQHVGQSSGGIGLVFGWFALIFSLLRPSTGGLPGSQFDARRRSSDSKHT
jgi:hypothetical protein